MTGVLAQYHRSSILPGRSSIKPNPKAHSNGTWEMGTDHQPRKDLTGIHFEAAKVWKGDSGARSLNFRIYQGTFRSLPKCVEVGGSFQKYTSGS